MSEAVQKFVFAGVNEVRVVMQGTEPWFVAKDVCDVLGTRTDHIKDIIGYERVKSIDPLTVGDNGRGHGKDILVVSESGLYKLIMVSRKPEAVKFQDWVTDEVLPTIRKHGSYMTDSTLERVKTDPEYIYNLAKMLVEEKESREIAEYARDEAVRTKAWISDRKTATAMQTASALTRRNHRLETEKQALLDRIDEIDEELGTQTTYANRYWDWRSKVGRPPKGYVRPSEYVDDELLF